LYQIPAAENSGLPVSIEESEVENLSAALADHVKQHGALQT